MTNSTRGRCIRINGGRYHLEDLSMEGVLPNAFPFVVEGGINRSTLIGGNYVNNCFARNTRLTATNCVTDPAKTVFNYETFVQAGFVTTEGGTVANVTFLMPFRSTPAVTCQVFANDRGGTMYDTGVAARAKLASLSRPRRSRAVQ